MIDIRMPLTLAVAGLLAGPLGAHQSDTNGSRYITEATTRGPSLRSAASLELVQYVADSSAFHVNSVLIVGLTEAILIDAQYHAADARHVADQIAATGKRLKAVFITHPDHDHFGGAAVIKERFPDTPFYMTAAALHHFESKGVKDFEQDRARQSDILADSVVTPQVLPSTHLTVDGETVEIIPDLQGDVLSPVNSVVWIPSLRTLITSDLVFNGVHVWLGASSEESRAAWRHDLQQLAERDPVSVIAGHKPTVDTPDTPSVLQTMVEYLTDFDALRAASKDGAGLAGSMREKYSWKVAGLLAYSARVAFQQQ